MQQTGLEKGMRPSIAHFCLCRPLPTVRRGRRVGDPHEEDKRAGPGARLRRLSSFPQEVVRLCRRAHPPWPHAATARGWPWQRISGSSSEPTRSVCGLR